jgi:hypothetical protein
VNAIFILWLRQFKRYFRSGARTIGSTACGAGLRVSEIPAAWCEPDQESRMVLKIERFQPEGMNGKQRGRVTRLLG